LVVIAILVGSALLKQIDFKNLSVDKPVLAILYAIVLAVSVFLLVRRPKA